MSEPALTIVNSDGRTFNVRYRDGKNTATGKPTVSFWDATYEDKMRFGPLGQFVADYYVDTLLTDAGRLHNGLCLNGGVPVWNIDGPAMSVVLHWLDLIDQRCTT